MPMTAEPFNSVLRPAAAHRLADMRQARLFIDMLRSELDELTSIGRGAQAGGQRGGVLSARVDEVTRLLEALESRFPLDQ